MLLNLHWSHHAATVLLAVIIQLKNSDNCKCNQRESFPLYSHKLTENLKDLWCGISREKNFMIDTQNSTYLKQIQTSNNLDFLVKYRWYVLI